MNYIVSFSLRYFLACFTLFAIVCSSFVLLAFTLDYMSFFTLGFLFDLYVIRLNN